MYRARTLAATALALWLFLLTSHGVWEGGMATHVGLELPLLVLVGAWAMLACARRWPVLSAIGCRYRASLFLAATFTLLVWMVPRLLDASLHDPVVAMLKWTSLPLAGASLVWSWPHLPRLLRAVLQLEVLATLVRLGWLYIEAPQRYCVSYRLDQQQTLGYLLLGYAALYAAVLGYRLLFAAPQRVAALSPK